MAKTPKQKIVSKKHLARIEREKIQNRNILVVSILILVVIVGLIGYGILNETVLKMQKPVAKVGSDLITTRDYITMVKYSRMTMIQSYQQYKQYAQFFGDNESITNQLSQYEYSLSDKTIIGAQVLDQMIDELLIKQEAEKRGITVSKAELDKEVETAFGYYPEGTPSPTITPTDVMTPTFSATQLALVTITPTPTLAPTSTPAPTETPDPATPTATTAAPTESPTPEPTATPYTYEGFKGAVDEYLTSVEDLNFTRSDLVRIVENQLIRRKLYELITKDLKPEGEQVWARHILVADEIVADDIYVRLTGGEDFATLAAKFSTDTSNNLTGGDLGWFTRGAMVQEFEDAAFSLEIGAISTPVVTQNGYHIIQVLDRQVLPLNASQFQTLKDSTFNDWLTKAREENADIEKFDRWMDVVPEEPVLTTE